MVVVFLLKFARPFDTLQTPVECAVFSLWQYLQISSAWIVTGMYAVEIYVRVLHFSAVHGAELLRHREQSSSPRVAVAERRRMFSPNKRKRPAASAQA